MPEMVRDNVNPQFPGQPPEPLAESAGSPGVAEAVAEQWACRLFPRAGCQNFQRAICEADYPRPCFPNYDRRQGLPIHLRGRQ